jgi:hypothetical protein
MQGVLKLKNILRQNAKLFFLEILIENILVEFVVILCFCILFITDSQFDGLNTA